MATDSGGRRPQSLALRVTVLVGLATSLLFLLFAWSVERSIELHFARMDLQQMRAAWHALDGALEPGSGPGAVPPLAARLQRAMAGNGTVAYLVRGAGGSVLARNTTPQLERLLQHVAPAADLQLDELRIVAASGHAWRIAVFRSATRSVALAVNVDFHLQYLNALQNALWGGTFVASLITVLVAGLAVRQGHVPLRRISARMRALSAERLSTRLDPQRVPVELQELVEAFNAMLDRIEASFERLREVSADIAHELRTPITNLTTQTQVALSQTRDAAAYREVLYSNLEEFERLSAMIADMLFLAQSDRGRAGLQLGPVDLLAQARDLTEYFELLADERGVRLTVSGTAPRVIGDKAMLRRALSNLLSNAVRHTPEGGSVAIRLRADAGCVSVAVSNEGAPIAAEHLERIFERFYRVDPSRQRGAEGAGLGLAIVQSIVALHGGQVRARSEGGTTTFEMQLPLASSAA